MKFDIRERETNELRLDGANFRCQSAESEKAAEAELERAKALGPPMHSSRWLKAI